jgi:hypothetical protein
MRTIEEIRRKHIEFAAKAAGQRAVLGRPMQYIGFFIIFYYVYYTVPLIFVLSEYWDAAHLFGFYLEHIGKFVCGCIGGILVGYLVSRGGQEKHLASALTWAERLLDKVENDDELYDHLDKLILKRNSYRKKWYEHFDMKSTEKKGMDACQRVLSWVVSDNTTIRGSSCPILRPKDDIISEIEKEKSDIRRNIRIRIILSLFILIVLTVAMVLFEKTRFEKTTPVCYVVIFIFSFGITGLAWYIFQWTHRWKIRALVELKAYHDRGDTETVREAVAEGLAFSFDDVKKQKSNPFNTRYQKELFKARKKVFEWAAGGDYKPDKRKIWGSLILIALLAAFFVLSFFGVLSSDKYLPPAPTCDYDLGKISDELAFCASYVEHSFYPRTRGYIMLHNKPPLKHNPIASSGGAYGKEAVHIMNIFFAGRKSFNITWRSNDGTVEFDNSGKPHDLLKGQVFLVDLTVTPLTIKQIPVFFENGLDMDTIYKIMGKSAEVRKFLRSIKLKETDVIREKFGLN